MDGRGGAGRRHGAGSVPTRVCCQQLDPTLGDLDGNRRRALTAIDEAIDAGADVVVLPELATSGYVFESEQEVEAVALAPDHEILREWGDRASAHDVIVAGGFPERAPDGRTYNSAAVFDATGRRAVYRKLHLWDREKLWFAPGALAPPLIETRVGRLSVIVCYDVEFPELTRSVALAGAQLLLVPTNWPLMDRPESERPAEVVIAMATARANRMAVACADRTGVERGQRWTGCSTIVGADGWVASELTGDRALATAPVIADLDLELALDKRYTEMADVFGDRRPELYRALADLRVVG